MPEGFSETISQLNPNIFTWDLFVAIGFIAVAFLWFYTRGKDFVVTMILGVYVSATTVVLAPLVAGFNFDLGSGLQAYQWQVLAFLLLLLVFSWLMATNGYFEPYTVPSGWELPVFVVLFCTLALETAFSFTPPEAVAGFSPVVRTVFGHEALATLWMTAPIAVLLFIRGNTD